MLSIEIFRKMIYNYLELISSFNENSFKSIGEENLDTSSQIQTTYMVLILIIVRPLTGTRSVVSMFITRVSVRAPMREPLVLQI